MVTEEESSERLPGPPAFELISPIIAIGAFALIFVPCMMAGQALASGIYADLVSVGIMSSMFPLAYVLVILGSVSSAR